MSKKIFEINGNNFSTLEEFAKEFSEKLNLDVEWNGNLDALNDILRGGFGTSYEGFILVWKNSSLSKERLGYNETLRQLEKRLERCHSANRNNVRSEIELAKAKKSATVFDWLVEIIRNEEHNDIELRLE